LLKERLETVSSIHANDPSNEGWALGFEAAAGLSLGEFTALTAAGAMSFEDGLRVVRRRGLFMQEACDATLGAMAAVIGMDEGPTR